jgi:ribonuclease HII
MDKLVCGVDEAGRGPVIGPLMLACAVFDSNGAQRLRELSVKDSKKVTPERRSYLEPLIKSIAVEYVVAGISPAEIDIQRKRKSLNDIEALKVAEMLLSMNSRPDRIILDAADSVAENYGRRIIGHLQRLDKNFAVPEVVSEHKADDTYIEVSAASILAKVERDRQVGFLREKYGNFGSGYPSDETTQSYVKKAVKDGDLPAFIRRSWDTVNRGRQKTLDDY